MPNKRSEGGQRNRDLLGQELASFLADLGELAADLGVAREDPDRAPEELEAEASPPPEEPEAAPEEAALGTADPVLPPGGAPPLEVIEELPSMSPSYLPPLPPEDWFGDDGEAAMTPEGPLVPFPSPDSEVDPVASITASLAPFIPGGLPVLVSRRAWSLAAAMEPLEPLSPPQPRPAPPPQPEMVAALRPALSPSRTRPELRLPLLPAVVLAMLGVVIVLLVLKLVHG